MPAHESAVRRAGLCLKVEGLVMGQAPAAVAADGTNTELKADHPAY